MKTLAKCAAVASVILLTAGSAAWAQGYNNNTGHYGNRGYTPNTQPYNQGNQGYQGANSGNWNNSQAGSGQGMQGSSGQYSENSGAGYNSNMNYGFNAARNELSQYGYTDIHNLRATQGWSADAMKNGRMVHVVISENGLVSTFSGE